MSNVKRFYFNTKTTNPSGVSEIRLTYETYRIAKWLGFDEDAVLAWLAEIEKRLEQEFPGANVTMNGSSNADGFAWIIKCGPPADEGRVLFKCQEILETIELDQDAWCPKPKGGIQ